MIFFLHISFHFAIIVIFRSAPKCNELTNRRKKNTNWQIKEFEIFVEWTAKEHRNVKFFNRMKRKIDCFNLCWIFSAQLWHRIEKQQKLNGKFSVYCNVSLKWISVCPENGTHTTVVKIRRYNAYDRLASARHIDRHEEGDREQNAKKWSNMVSLV